MRFLSEDKQVLWTRERLVNICKIIIFILILLFIIFFAGVFFRPEKSTGQDEFNALYGFYQQPENTIETIFLGASQVQMGIIPTYLYEKYGLCSYNLGTGSQPLAASYYWLKESFSHHSESLSTVVLEVSMLRRDPEKSRYELPFDYMKYSKNRIEGTWSFTDNYSDFIIHMLPLLRYHDRWTGLKRIDFYKESDLYKKYTRGYFYNTKNTLYDQSIDEIPVLTPFSKKINTDEPVKFNDKSIDYLGQIIEFCSENDINLVLVRFPTLRGKNNWNSRDSDYLSELATENELFFVDFNFSPYYDELMDLGYDMLLCSYDDNHPNHYGAKIISDYLGKYLIEMCNNRNIKDDPKYSFMNDELLDYNRIIGRDEELNYSEDLYDYLIKAMSYNNCYVLISACEEATKALSEDYRELMSGIGLKGLSDLRYRDSYIAIIKDGEVIYEAAERNNNSKDDEKRLIIEYYPNEIKTWHESEENSSMYDFPLQTTLTLADGESCKIISGGAATLGDTSSICIAGEENSKKSLGLNIVVYDYEDNIVINSKNFNTFESIYNLSITDNLTNNKDIETKNFLSYPQVIQKALLYKRKLYNEKKNEYIYYNDISLLDYLDLWMEKDYIILISDKYEVGALINADSRSMLSEMGFYVLSDLNQYDSYIGIVDDGEIRYELSGNEGDPIELEMFNWSIISGGKESGNISSILINNQEYSKSDKGLNIVIYDKLLERVVNQSSFDVYDTL